MTRLLSVLRLPLLVLPVLLPAGCGPTAPWTEAPPVSIDLQAELSVATVPLLQPFELRLDLFHRSDLEVEFEPQVPAGTTGTVELLPERDLGRGRWRRAVLHLRAVAGPGPLAIAPFRAAAGDGTATASTKELQLTVTSLLATADADIEAPGPLLQPPAPLWPWLAAAGALLLLAFVVLWWRRRQRRPRRTPLTIELPPHIKALRELARLRSLPRVRAVDVEAFYVATSNVLRVYLEERFGLRAPERTTEEFLHEIDRGGPLSAAQCLEVRRFLQQCDLVKFAAMVPPEEAHLQTLAIAEQLVQSTRSDRQAMGVGA